MNSGRSTLDPTGIDPSAVFHPDNVSDVQFCNQNETRAREEHSTDADSHFQQTVSSEFARDSFSSIYGRSYSRVTDFLRNRVGLPNPIMEGGKEAIQSAVEYIARSYLLALAEPSVLFIEDENGNTVIEKAGMYGHLEMLGNLLRGKPPLLEKASRLLGPMLITAASAGDSIQVRNLLKYPSDLALEHVRGAGKAALCSAAREGHISIVQDLLDAIKGPIFSAETDPESLNPLLATAFGKGTSAIATLLLLRQPDLINTVVNDKGDSILHLAAERKHTDLGLELLRFDPCLASAVNRKRETALHIATRQKLSKLVTALLWNHRTNINAETVGRQRAIDLLSQFENSSDVESIRRTLQYAADAAALRSDTVLEIPDIINAQSDLGDYIHAQNRRTRRMSNKRSSMIKQLAKEDNQNTYIKIQTGIGKEGLQNTEINGQTGKYKSIDAKSRQTQSRGNGRHRIARQLHNEGIQNATNTVVVVAVLIATLAFAALFTVPGGLQSSGKEMGSAVKLHSAAFQVFFISNSLALFTSLALVIVLVAIIPLDDKFRRALLAYGNKLIWIAIACCAVSYIAAAYIITGPATMYFAVCILGFCILATVYVVMIYLQARHYKKKSKWRRNKKEEKTREGDKKKGGSSNTKEYVQNEDIDFLQKDTEDDEKRGCRRPKMVTYGISSGFENNSTSNSDYHSEYTSTSFYAR